MSGTQSPPLQSTSSPFMKGVPSRPLGCCPSSQPGLQGSLHPELWLPPHPHLSCPPPPALTPQAAPFPGTVTFPQTSFSLGQGPARPLFSLYTLFLHPHSTLANFWFSLDVKLLGGQGRGMCNILLYPKCLAHSRCQINAE